MGVAIPVGGVQIVNRWLCSGDNEEMVSTIGASGRGPYSDAQALAGSFAALTTTNLCSAAMMLSGWTYVGCTVYIAQDGGAAEVGESNVNVAGTVGAAGQTINTATLVHKRTALAGRRGQGRMYLPPFSLSEGETNMNGSLTAAYVSSAQTRVTDWFNAMNTALDTDELVLFHSLGGASGTEVLPGTPITALVVDNKLATQRRRMRP